MAKLLCSGFVVLLALASAARADIEDDEFFSKEWGITMRAPSTWQMTEQTSYPNIILHVLRPYPPGRMLLSAECVGPGLTPFDYATKTAKLLEKLGFRVRPPQLHAHTGAFWLDFDNGKAFLRQALLVSGPTAYALTLSATDARTRSLHLRAFDSALRSVKVQRSQRCARTTGGDARDVEASGSADTDDGEPANGKDAKPADGK